MPLPCPNTTGERLACLDQFKPSHDTPLQVTAQFQHPVRMISEKCLSAKGTDQLSGHICLANILFLTIISVLDIISLTEQKVGDSKYELELSCHLAYVSDLGMDTGLIPKSLAIVKFGI